QPSTVNRQPSTVNRQPSTGNRQPATGNGRAYDDAVRMAHAGSTFSISLPTGTETYAVLSTPKPRIRHLNAIDARAGRAEHRGPKRPDVTIFAQRVP
ncbi:MAG: hypothetical protein ABJE10_12525, partial [bacterium]